MGIASVNDLVTVLGEHQLLDAAHQDELVRRVGKQFQDPKRLIKELVSRGWITPFQTSIVASGKASQLVIGPYVVLDKLGQGGMGQVFKARHQTMGRIVALKVIRRKHLAQGNAVKRFLREIKAASQLSHPNIVSAHDADQVGDIHYFAMEYVEGIDLAKLAKKYNQLPVAIACDFIRQAANGLQHAFERSLIHRDIKPSNLLVTKKGQGGPHPWGIVKILDMGLARAVEGGDGEMENTLTQAGTVVGTPDYISPEQARDSRSADIRSDIYSLGCTLYRMLAGQVMFVGGTAMEKLFKQQLETPPPLSECRADVPAELQAVLDRMLAKKQEDRYQTPAEVAQALEPFARRDRSTAQPGSDGFQAFEQTMATPDPERPTATVGPSLWRRPKIIAGVFGLMGMIILAGLGYTYLGGPGEEPPGPPGPSPLDKLDQVIQGKQFPDLPSEVVAVFGSPKLQHGGIAGSVCFDPAGKTIASGGTDRVIRLWDAATGSLQGVLDGFTSAVNHVAYADGGKTLVGVDTVGNIRIYDAANQAYRTKKKLPDGNLTPIAISPDGHTLAILQQRTILLWDIMHNRRRFQLDSGGGLGTQVRFSPDSSTAVTFRRRSAGDIQVWDTQTGSRKKRIPLQANIHSVSLNAAGDTLAASTQKGIHVFNAITGQELHAQPYTRKFLIPLVAISADGKSLASLNFDRISAGQLADFPNAKWTHKTSGKYSRFMVSPDGRYLAAYGLAAHIRLWDTATGKDRFPNQWKVDNAGFGLEGKCLVTTNVSGQVKVVHTWDVKSGRDEGRLTDGTLIRMSSDGKRAIIKTARGIEVFDLETKSKIGQAPSARFQQQAVVSRDGRIAVQPAGIGNRLPVVWDLTTFRRLPALQEFDGLGLLAQLALSGDGKVLAVAAKGKINLFDTATGRRSDVVLDGDVKRFAFIRLNPDGSRLAASYFGGLMLWNTKTGQMVRQRKAKFFAYKTTFSPDGKTLVSWNQNTLGLWNGVTGQPIESIPSVRDTIGAAFSLDSRTLVTVDKEGQVSSWNVATGKRQNISTPGPVSRIAFAPDGRHLATVNVDGTVYILRMPPDA